MKSRIKVLNMLTSLPTNSTTILNTSFSYFSINAFFKLCLLITAVLSFSVSHAQTGPGGIGNKMGTSTLEVWLEAGDLDGDGVFTDNPANTTAVDTWTDKSGNANHLIQSTSANQPFYTTGTFNSVEFSAAGTLDYMNFTTTSNFIPGTAYFVLNPTDAGLVSNTLLDDASRSLRWEQYSNTNRIGYTRYGVNDYTSGLAPNYGNNTIVGFLKSNANNNLQIRQDNATSTVDIGSSTDGIPLTRMGAIVAADAANYKAMEVIVFSAVLNTAQIRILENYLSAKYGGISISNDQYTMDDAGLDFDFDVAGIGRVDGSNLHNDASSSIVEILNPSSLGNSDFLYVGHNGGLLQSNTTDVPSPIQSKLQRIWGVNEANNIGTVTIRFDLTGMGSVTPSDLRLLIDTDNDGVFNEASTTIVSSATAFSGNVYQFAGVNLNNNTRFTLGTINTSVTPLPVELVSFDSKAKDGKVTLTWETATEINNDYFTLYRSVDGLNYGEIVRINGNGTTNQRQYYEHLDHTPPSGRIYYRIKQTDYDGTEKYVGITTTEVTLQNSRVSLYPNPVKPGSWVTVQLHSEPDGNLDFNLFNSTGQLRQLEFENANGELKVFIPENTPSGPYVMSTGANGKSNQIKVIVK